MAVTRHSSPYIDTLLTEFPRTDWRLTGRISNQDVLESDLPVLVDFWAPWCAPCLLLAPIVEMLAEKYAGRARVIELKVDQNRSVSERYGIKGIPTLILFKGGAEEERVVGATSEEAISLIIERCAGTARQ